MYWAAPGLPECLCLSLLALFGTLIDLFSRLGTTFIIDPLTIQSHIVMGLSHLLH